MKDKLCTCVSEALSDTANTCCTEADEWFHTFVSAFEYDCLDFTSLKKKSENYEWLMQFVAFQDDLANTSGLKAGS